MINPKNIESEDFSYEYISPYSKILSLQSVLQGRLNLLNIFKPLANPNHRPMTLENINIDINSEESIENFMFTNTNYIQYTLSKYMNDWFLVNGSNWQKKRVLENIKREEEGE